MCLFCGGRGSRGNRGVTFSIQHEAPARPLDVKCQNSREYKIFKICNYELKNCIRVYRFVNVPFFFFPFSVQYSTQGEDDDDD